MEIAIASTELESLFILWGPFSHLATFAALREGRGVTVCTQNSQKPLRKREEKKYLKIREEAWNDISSVANITAMQTGLISCYWEAAGNV